MTLDQLSILLNIPKTWLRTVFEIESGNSPQAYNPTTGATGLIQFMPATAAGLGTSTGALYNMNYNDQLDFVYKYLKPYKNKINSISDLYLTVFYPYAVGKPKNYILGSEQSGKRALIIGSQNPAYATNGYIKKGNIEKYVKNKYKKLGNSNISYIFERINKYL